MIAANAKKQAGRYLVVYSRDPALLLPDDPSERERALEVARETQQYGSITQPGGTLSLFTMQRLDREVFASWMEARDANGNKRVGSMSWFMRLAKLALVKVENFTDVKVRRIKDKEFGDAADESVFEPLNDPDLVADLLVDLGASVFAQEQITVPKS